MADRGLGLHPAASGMPDASGKAASDLVVQLSRAEEYRPAHDGIPRGEGAQSDGIPTSPCDTKQDM